MHQASQQQDAADAARRVQTDAVPLCATATPAPNDWPEFGTHAEFLGVCTGQEMLAEFFTHDGGDTQTWRLGGHARQVFWRWVCQWGALVRKPSDLGFDDSAYNLPPLHLHEHHVETEMPTNGMLFAMEAQTLSERRDARRLSIEDRVRDCASIVNADSEPWVVWCDLNAESESLTAAIHGAVEIRGSDGPRTRRRRWPTSLLVAFACSSRSRRSQALV